MKRYIIMLSAILAVGFPVFAMGAHKEDAADRNETLNEVTLNSASFNAVDTEKSGGSLEAVESQKPRTLSEPEQKRAQEQKNVQADGVENNNWKGNVAGQHRELERQW